MMPLLLYGFLFIVFLSCVGVVGSQGIWGSLITLFNVLTAIVLALNLFEPAATWIDSQMPSYTFLIDVVVLWGLFAIFAALFGLLTGFASRVKVRFLKPIDMAGGFVISLWTAWLLVAFIMLSLHTAPLPRSSFGGAFQPEPESRMMLGADRKLLAFMHKLSQGALAASPPREFDPQAKFILTYGARRAVFETTRDLRVDRDFGVGMIERGTEIREQ